MSYSENVADKIRQALAHLPDVEEKKMFGKLAFMVNGKMCLTAGPERMMCRIDQDIHDEAIQREGSKTVVMRGRKLKGYVYVSEEYLQQKRDFNYWIKLALDFNDKTVLPVKKQRQSKKKR
jgi:TfoX/Sxy family transcriptional regulator of competence genes